MAFSFENTKNFPFSLNFSNEFYEVFQPSNGNLSFTLPQGDTTIAIHPTDPDLFFFGRQENSICLNWRLCTNLGPFILRKDFIDAVIALAADEPSSE